jgi:hypothetical protein
MTCLGRLALLLEKKGVTLSSVAGHRLAVSPACRSQ